MFDPNSLKKFENPDKKLALKSNTTDLAISLSNQSKKISLQGISTNVTLIHSTIDKWNLKILKAESILEGRKLRLEFGKKLETIKDSITVLNSNIEEFTPDQLEKLFEINLFSLSVALLKKDNTYTEILLSTIQEIFKKFITELNATNQRQIMIMFQNLISARMIADGDAISLLKTTQEKISNSIALAFTKLPTRISFISDEKLSTSLNGIESNIKPGSDPIEFELFLEIEPLAAENKLREKVKKLSVAVSKSRRENASKISETENLLVDQIIAYLTFLINPDKAIVKFNDLIASTSVEKKKILEQKPSFSKTYRTENEASAFIYKILYTHFSVRIWLATHLRLIGKLSQAKEELAAIEREILEFGNLPTIQDNYDVKCRLNPLIQAARLQSDLFCHPSLAINHPIQQDNKKTIKPPTPKDQQTNKNKSKKTKEKRKSTKQNSHEAATTKLSSPEKKEETASNLDSVIKAPEKKLEEKKEVAQVTSPSLQTLTHSITTTIPSASTSLEEFGQTPESEKGFIFPRRRGRNKGQVNKAQTTITKQRDKDNNQTTRPRQPFRRYSKSSSIRPSARSTQLPMLKLNQLASSTQITASTAKTTPETKKDSNKLPIHNSVTIHPKTPSELENKMATPVANIEKKKETTTVSSSMPSLPIMENIRPPEASHLSTPLATSSRQENNNPVNPTQKKWSSSPLYTRDDFIREQQTQLPSSEYVPPLSATHYPSPNFSHPLTSMVYTQAALLPFKLTEITTHSNLFREIPPGSLPYIVEVDSHSGSSYMLVSASAPLTFPVPLPLITIPRQEAYYPTVTPVMPDLHVPRFPSLEENKKLSQNNHPVKHKIIPSQEAPSPKSDLTYQEVIQSKTVRYSPRILPSLKPTGSISIKNKEQFPANQNLSINSDMMRSKSTAASNYSPRILKRPSSIDRSIGQNSSTTSVENKTEDRLNNKSKGF